MDRLATEQKNKILSHFNYNHKDETYSLPEFKFEQSSFRGSKKEEYSIYGVYDKKTESVRIYMKGYIDPSSFDQKGYNVARECKGKYMYVGTVPLSKFKDATRGNLLKPLIGGNKEDMNRLVRAFTDSIRAHVHNSSYYESVSLYDQAYSRSYQLIDGKKVKIRTIELQKAEKYFHSESLIRSNQVNFVKQRSKALCDNYDKGIKHIKFLREKANEKNAAKHLSNESKHDGPKKGSGIQI